jgi:serine/threonine-protein kinase RsbW
LPHSQRDRAVDISITVPGQPASLDTLHAALAIFWERVEQAEPSGDGMRRIRFDTAVAELVANVIEHALGGDASMSAGVTLRAIGDELSFDIVDEGRPFPGSNGELPDELEESGRGLQIARQLLDELVYERHHGANRWIGRLRLA